MKLNDPNVSGKNGEATKPQRSPEELRIALHTAEVNRRDVKEKKKSVVAGYTATIKDLELEINDLLDQLKAQEGK